MPAGIRWYNICSNARAGYNKSIYECYSEGKAYILISEKKTSLEDEKRDKIENTDEKKKINKRYRRFHLCNRFGYMIRFSEENTNGKKKKTAVHLARVAHAFEGHEWILEYGKGVEKEKGELKNGRLNK